MEKEINSSDKLKEDIYSKFTVKIIIKNNTKSFAAIKDDILTSLNKNERISNSQDSIFDYLQKKISIKFSESRNQAYISNLTLSEGSLILGFDLLIIAINAFVSCRDIADNLIQSIEQDLTNNLPPIYSVTSSINTIQQGTLNSNNSNINMQGFTSLKKLIFMFTILNLMILSGVGILWLGINKISDENKELIKNLNKELNENNKEQTQYLKEYIDNKTEIVRLSIPNNLRPILRVNNPPSIQNSNKIELNKE